MDNKVFVEAEASDTHIFKSVLENILDTEVSIDETKNIIAAFNFMKKAGASEMLKKKPIHVNYAHELDKDVIKVQAEIPEIDLILCKDRYEMTMKVAQKLINKAFLSHLE
jgi:hypothetical protein